MKTVSAFAELICFCILISLHGFAKDDATAEALQPGVVLLNLSPPMYPPLARQARIMGDVKLYVHVRKDGSVESAELFSGHPMLVPTALQSARQSQFVCRGRGDEIRSYPITFTFGFLDDG